jgi:two-component sensor histidine kinase
MPRNTALFDPTIKGEAVVRAADIRSDPRYGRNAPHHGMPKGHLPVVSYLAVPVIGRNGEVLGGLFFGHDEPGRFSQEAEDDVASIAAHAAIAIDNARLLKAAQEEAARRRQAEEAKELLLQETQHRVKNTLGVVQAMASQTFRSASVEERKSFGARLQALAEAHNLLARRQWDEASATEVVAAALGPFRDSGRFVTQGPQTSLPADKALLLAMVLHELATNAVKYGALSNGCGRVEIGWETDDNALQLRWRESGGPPVLPPSRKGFGSTLIERALASGRSAARIDYAPEGVICSLTLALR